MKAAFYIKYQSKKQLGLRDANDLFSIPLEVEDQKKASPYYLV